MTVIWSLHLATRSGLPVSPALLAPEVEGVLPFGQYRVALLLPPLTLLVQQGGVVQEPPDPFLENRANTECSQWPHGSR